MFLDKSFHYQGAIVSLKEDIIHESLKLFSLKGFLSTSIGEIIQQAKTSKGGFYNYFKSKDDLFQAVLAEAQKIWRERVLTDLEQNVMPSQKLKRLLQNYSERYLKDSDNIPGGCIFLTLTVELNDQRPDCAAKVNEGIIGLKRMIKRYLDQAVVLGELRQDVDTETSAMVLFTGMLGTSVLYGMEKAEPLLRHSVDTLSDYIDSLMG